MSRRLLFWNPRSHRKDQNPDHHSNEQQDRLVSDCLARMDELLGGGPRFSLVNQLARWDGDVILSGMQTEDGTVWRLTCEFRDGQDRDDVLISDNPPTFRTEQETVQFPGGRLTQFDRPLSSQGWWIAGSTMTRPQRRSLNAGNSSFPP